ncbi:MAG: 5'-methylthioadenosine/S-adenosylhomocysteine nucleosidase [Cyanobacteria bacterium P01_F01_bin.86]
MNISLNQQISASVGLNQSSTTPKTTINPILSIESAFDDWGNPCIVILTAISVECLAVCNHLTKQRQVKSSKHTIYECGEFQSTEKRSWNVVVAEIGEGNTSAGRETERAIDCFHPSIVMFVGVAGGIKDVQLGDVVAATKVYDYESGKDEETFLPRPNLGAATYDLEQLARATRRDWELRKDSLSEGSYPNAFVAPIAAGSKVIASKQSGSYASIKNSYGNAVAVEMEGFGLLDAVRANLGVSAIVIRGISDLIEAKEKSDAAGFQKIAACHASNFAFEMLAKLDSESLTEQSQVYQTSAQVALDSTLPEGMISLNVQALLEENQYYIHAHHKKQTFTSRGQFDQSLMNLYQQIENNLAADNLLSVIDDCNANVKNSVDCLAGKLLTWLHRQQNYSLDQIPCLIIDERTEVEIPWELLESGAKPVGVVFQTVRQWQKMEPKTMPVTACCGGGVLVYAHERYGGWHGYEQRPFTVFQEFLRQMQTPEEEFGLVFIDGFSVEEPLRNSPTAYIKRSKLFKSGTSIVFISGQLHLDASIGLKTHRALLTNFLEHGAKGVVGTLRGVERSRAKEVVEQFSEEHRQNPEWTVPEILRRIRERVWEALEDEVNENNCAAYLTTFLHVYYGNPITRLQLVSAEGESNV